MKIAIRGSEDATTVVFTPETEFDRAVCQILVNAEAGSRDWNERHYGDTAEQPVKVEMKQGIHAVRFK